MKECSKSIPRRLADVNFTRSYFVGHGIDIGGRPDPLGLYRELFCRMESVRTWDLEDGDAQFLDGVSNESLDFVHSCHCLEHIADPAEALNHWMRVLKPGGHMIVVVPDEDMYEQGVFPSTFNTDHKWTFTTYKHRSWSGRSLNLLDLVRNMGPEAELVCLEQLTATYRRELPRYDQTVTPVGETSIEMIVRKRPTFELALGGRIQQAADQPDREMRIHLNQHRNDLQTLKQRNLIEPPFQDDAPL